MNFPEPEQKIMQSAIPDTGKALSGVMIHTGAIQTPAGAVLFTGPSGIGKSTICRLLSKNYACISDDAVFLSQKSNTVWTVQSAHHYIDRLRCIHLNLSKEYKETNPEPKLLAICALQQADENLFTPIDNKTACANLVDRLIEINKQSQTLNTFTLLHGFKMVANISRNVPGWNLQFCNDERIQRAFDSFVESNLTNAEERGTE